MKPSDHANAKVRPVSKARPGFPTQRASQRLPLSQVGLEDSFRLLDAVAIMLPLALAYQASAPSNILAASVKDVGPYFVAGFLYYFVLVSSEVYRLRPRMRPTAHIIHLLSVCIVATGVGLLGAALFGVADRPLNSVMMGLAWATGALLWAHVLYAAVRRRLRLSGRLQERIVIIGATDTAARLIGSAKESGDALPVGVFHDKAECSLSSVSGIPVLGDVIDLLSWPELPQADRIVICIDPLERGRISQLISRIAMVPQPISLAFELPRKGDAPPAVTMIGATPLASVNGIAPNPRRAQVKRIADIVISGAALVVLSPVFALIAVLIKADSPGPVFFVQQRHGYNNGVLRVLKFRAMYHTSQGEADRMQRQVCAGDPHVTLLGRLLRATSLDELPQLLNVLRGDMSLVGPRPHAVGMMVEGLDPFALFVDYAYRHRVKPGLTGWAQVNGARGPVGDRHELAIRLAYDLAYVRSMSLWFDAWILLRTLPLLFGDPNKIR